MKGKSFIYLFWLSLVMVLYVGIVLPKMLSAANTAINLGALVSLPILIVVWINAVTAVVKDLWTNYQSKKDKSA